MLRQLLLGRRGGARGLLTERSRSSQHGCGRRQVWKAGGGGELAEEEVIPAAEVERGRRGGVAAAELPYEVLARRAHASVWGEAEVEGVGRRGRGRELRSGAGSHRMLRRDVGVRGKVGGIWKGGGGTRHAVRPPSALLTVISHAICAHLGVAIGVPTWCGSLCGVHRRQLVPSRRSAVSRAMSAHAAGEYVCVCVEGALRARRGASGEARLAADVPSGQSSSSYPIATRAGAAAGGAGGAGAMSGPRDDRVRDMR